MRYSFRMLAHWDEVETVERAFGDIRSTRQYLGAAAGAVAIGCSRFRVPAGARNAPVHVHADEEEIAYVLGGHGCVWREGRAYPVSAGDAIVFRVGDGAHTLLGGPLDVLVFGEGSRTSLTWLPRCNVMWAGTRWLPLDGPHPFEAEAAAGPLERAEPVDPADERPPWLVALTDVEGRPSRRGRTDVVRTDLGRAGGSHHTGLNHVRIAPSAWSHPAHCHTVEEELFVVLGGEGWLVLEERDGPAEWPVRRGSVVARPPGTGVAHTFRAGEQGLELLAYGQRNPGDVCFYPRSGKLGIGPITFRVEPVDYWDGEE